MAINSEFDEYAKTYSGDLRSALRPFAADPRSILTTKANVLCSVVRSSGLSPRDCRLLDVGCGIGLLTAELVRWFDSVTGVDVSARSIDYAAENDKRTAYVHYDGGKLPFEMNSFDVVLASCVLHHVSVSNRGAFVQEMARVARAAEAPFSRRL